MYDIFLSIDKNTELEELEKIVRYNIGKANILREKIKELDKVEMLTEKRSNEIKEIQKEEEVDSEEIEEEEYIYYYRNMKKELKTATNQEEIIDAILDTFPSCENKSYSSIVNRIKLELLKEIHDLDMMLTEEDTKNDVDLIEEVNKEKSRIQGYIDTIYYIQTEKKEIQVEKAINTENKLIFLETATGSIYAENDLFSIPEEYYQTFKELLLTIKKGTFKNVRTFSSNHKTLNSISEVKDFKTRVVFERLGKNTYAIIDIFVKKSDNDAGYRTALVNRVDYYKKTKSYLQEMIKDDAFLEKNRKIEENLINGLENKKLIKTGKGGNQSGK